MSEHPGLEFAPQTQILQFADFAVYSKPSSTLKRKMLRHEYQFNMFTVILQNEKGVL